MRKFKQIYNQIIYNNNLQKTPLKKDKKKGSKEKKAQCTKNRYLKKKTNINFILSKRTLIMLFIKCFRKLMFIIIIIIF